MDNSTLEVRQPPWTYTLYCVAMLAEVCWAVSPLLRRSLALSTSEWLVLSIAPTLFIIGIRFHRSALLLMGVPASWLVVLPLAPRDGLGSEEVFAMAISLLAYCVVVVARGRNHLPEPHSARLVWTAQPEDASSIRPTMSLVWVVPCCVVVSIFAILVWPSLQTNLSQYPPGVSSRMQVVMIFLLGGLGLFLTHRIRRAQFGWLNRKTTALFGALAGLNAVLFIGWRLL